MTAEAWSPGHATLLFRPVERDGRYVGSTGAGLCLSTGATTTLDPGGSGEPHPVAETVLEILEVDAGARHDLEAQLGAGLGISGAVALSTGLAAVALTGRTYRDAVDAAHEAELRHGTGLGDVRSQATGGLVLRPSTDATDRVPVPDTGLRVEVLGERETEEHLDAAEDLPELDALLEAPSLENALLQGRRFSRRTGLGTDRAAEEIERARRRGGDGAQAHLGDTVLLTGTGEPTARISHAPAHVTEVTP